MLLVIKLVLSYSDNHWSRPLLWAGVMYFGFAIWSNNFVSLRFYPALVSGVMLVIFSWSLYNGLIAYLLMGILLGREYVVRMKTQKHVR